ncbi:5-hydroxytryptamine receptor 2A [Orobanche gracilis]
MKKTHLFRHGIDARREIRKYQKLTEILIRKLPFQMLVRKIAKDCNPAVRFQPSDLASLHEMCMVKSKNILSEKQGSLLLSHVFGLINPSPLTSVCTTNIF